jgi:DNA-binding MarR family transcriptional regulator
MDEGLRKDAWELVREMRRMRVGYSRYLSRALESIGLNISQFTALSVLDEKGEITMSALSDGMGITMGAVTNIVDRLSDASLATRERGTDDRRIVRVKLTEKGKDVLAKAMDIGTDYFAPYLAQVSQEERKTFIDVYRKLADLFTADLAK